MRTQEQIDNIKKNFSDPYIVENFITENDVLYLINLFDNSTPNQPKVYKNTGPVTLNIFNYLNDPVVNDIINRLKLAIGDFDITAGFWFWTDYPHIIHNDDLFELPDKMYKGITIPLKLDSDLVNNKLPELCFFDQCYFHGPSKFFNGDDEIPTYYNKSIYEYGDVDGTIDGTINDMDYKKYFTHLKREWLNGLSFKCSLPWKPGSCIIFDSVRLHCASDFRKLGYKSKLGISIFTKKND
jgi:hypothetical protein